MSPASTGAMPDSESETPTPKLSKSALKKAARAERYAASRLERRAKEKELRKEKKRIRAEKRGAGELDDEDEQHGRQKKKLKLEFGGRVVIDLGFDDKMTDKEIASLCSQLAYTYSANRNASYPFSLLHTSLNGRTLARLESMNDSGYRRWTETEWWTEGYEYLWTGQAGPISPKNQCNAPAMAAQNAVVYLTADSEEELLHLSPDETYIIGGLCDHNRYKVNLCLNKANKSGIRTARLPIGRYLASLPTRKVLTELGGSTLLCCTEKEIPSRKKERKRRDNGKPGHGGYAGRRGRREI
ncbi:hypothetical protein APHAL10511_001600 [Amanita phalloides]|nr:hypothetical protein APHAL10511_001600 [Amanita phalloides]